MSWKEITYKKIKWIDISSPTVKDMQKLGRDFGFHPLSLEDALYTQRSKVDAYDGKYYFLILMLPVFDAKKNIITATDVNMYIGKDFFVTIHDNNIPPIRKMFADAKKNPAWQKAHMSGQRPTHLIYEYIETMLRYFFPILEATDANLEKLETNIFSGPKTNTVREILEQRRIIIDLRKIVKPYESTLTHLHAYDKTHHILGISKTFEYFDNLLDYVAEAWDSLEEYKESSEMLQQANDAIISKKTGHIIQRLTTISVTFLPITLIAGIFGINARHMPFIGHPFDFWIIISLMCAIVLATIIFFKIQDWID